MTAFGKLIRTTAFRLTLVYLFLFALFAASLLGYFAWNTRRLINEQITATVNAEIAEINDHLLRAAACTALSTRSATGRCGRAPTSISSPRRRARRSAAMSSSLSPGVMASTRLVRDRVPPARRAGHGAPPRAGARHRTRPTVSACWSAAISRNGGGCSASSPMPRNGRCWSSSCSASAAASSWRGGCCSGSTP